MLFCSALHDHFSNLKYLLLSLVFKKLLAKFSLIFAWELRPLNHSASTTKIPKSRLFGDIKPLDWSRWALAINTVWWAPSFFFQAGKHMVPSKQRENLFYCSLACYNKATETVDLNMEKVWEFSRLFNLYCGAKK